MTHTQTEKMERLNNKQAIINYIVSQGNNPVTYAQLVAEVDIIWLNKTKSILKDEEFECVKLRRMENLNLPVYGYKVRESYLNRTA